MKTDKFPIIISETGVSASIRETIQTKKGRQYKFYVVDYFILGKRKRQWCSDLEQAKCTALDACRTISRGEQQILELKNDDRADYLRAKDALARVNVGIDTACREYADALTVLGGKGTILEACRDFVKRHSVQVSRVGIPEAVQLFKDYLAKDGKSEKRQRDIASVLDRFAGAFNIEVHTVTPGLISDYLTALPLKERTKRNHRDVIAFFSRWLVLRGYLPKGTDLLDGVQNYSARKLGEITTYSAEEMSLLLQHAGDKMLLFLVIAGFAGLRHAEIARLDWSEIDLAEGFIEVKAENAKTNTRRIVPIKDNLKAWLLPVAKPSGPVIGLANIANPLSKLSRKSGIKWKHNALRHTYISARVAECADVPRVADEAGNSPQIIRTNYLKRIRPALAAAWFSILPNPPGNVVPVTTEQKAA